MSIETARIAGAPKLRDPNDVLDNVFDWSAWLPVGDTIQSFTVHITDASATPLVAGVTSNDDTTVTVWLSGGTLLTFPTVTVRIVTVQGRTADATKVFRVANL